MDDKEVSKIVKKLKKTKKWKVNQEHDMLVEKQSVLRDNITRLEANLAQLKDDEIAALKANDGTTIAVLDASIKTTEKLIASKKEDYKNITDILEVYSKVLKNEVEARCANRNSWFGALATVSSIGLAAVGLKKAYDTDKDGTMVFKRTLDWTKSLPIIRNFGSGRK